MQLLMDKQDHCLLFIEKKKVNILRTKYAQLTKSKQQRKLYLVLPGWEQSHPTNPLQENHQQEKRIAQKAQKVMTISLKYHLKFCYLEWRIICQMQMRCFELEASQLIRDPIKHLYRFFEPEWYLNFQVGRSLISMIENYINLERKNVRNKF